MFIAAAAHLRAMLAKFNTEEGAGIVEYVLLIVAIALVVLLGIAIFSGGLNTLFGGLGNNLSDVNTSVGPVN